MALQEDAEIFRYQRLFGTTPDGLQLKVTVISGAGRIQSASLQMRAVSGPTPLSAHPALWSKPVPLTLNTIGEEFDTGGAA